MLFKKEDAVSDHIKKKYDAFKLLNSRNTTVLTNDPDREIVRGYLYLTKQFFWPSVDGGDYGVTLKSLLNLQWLQNRLLIHS